MYVINLTFFHQLRPLLLPVMANFLQNYFPAYLSSIFCVCICNNDEENMLLLFNLQVKTFIF